MRSLIIGGAGFVGGYLIDRVLLTGEVTATKLPNEKIDRQDIRAVDLQVTDAEAVKALLKRERPDRIYHLAAISSVSLSWKQPLLTVDVNIKGAINLLDAVRELDYRPRVLLIGSGEEYGAASEDELPIGEDNALRPDNIYAVTKICQNMIGGLYAKAYGLDVMMVRAFNHCGPGQADFFVVSDFARQIAEAEAGKREPVLRVGNLSARRDFTDVRDVVRAYELLMQNGSAGETYNVGSGHAIAIKDILYKLTALSKTDIRVETDEKKFRPVDVPVIEADTSKLAGATGWSPAIPLDVTLADTLEYWRKHTNNESI